LTEAPWVFCGAARLPVPRADAYEPPPRLARAEDLDWAIECALASPLRGPRLRHLARGAASVAITIPDASRRCPSPAVLAQLLDELTLADVSDDAVTVVIGCGLHDTTSTLWKDRLAGVEVTDRVSVVDAHGIVSPTVDLGVTSLGIPVHIDRTVAAADLAISVGVVEPHLYAGFSGGVKGVAIGCAGHETIARTHDPAFISLPGVAVAELAGNPFQQTLREIAAHTPLAHAVNLVMNEHGEAAAVAAGDPVVVQASLARAHRNAWLRPVDAPFDVLVAGVHAPKSDNFYQASRAVTYACLAARPALSPGGLVVLCADLSNENGQGPAERNCAALLAAASSPAAIIERARRESLGHGGQRAFVMARVLEHYRVAVVGAADPGCVAGFAHLGVTAFDTVDAALAAEDARLGRRARTLAVADAMATLVEAR
jgi:lactate racemase